MQVWRNSLFDRDQDAWQPIPVTVALRIEVTDPAALWSAAAARALAAPGTTINDVIDTLGPREDPHIGDCLLMLMLPGSIDGAVVTGVQVEDATDPAPPAGDTLHLVPRR